jgi:hypothetical protein
MAQPAAHPSSPSPGYPPGTAATSPIPSKSKAGLYAAIAAAVIVVVVVVALIAGGILSFKSSSSSPGLRSTSANVVNTQNQQFGPRLTGAGVYTFSVPAGAVGAWVNGSFQVVACTSVGDYCLANAEIMTPNAWANLQSGATVSVIWCPTAGTSTCQAEQTVQIASGDLSGYAGQTLNLVLYSNATTLSQTYDADATLTSLTPS